MVARQPPQLGAQGYTKAPPEQDPEQFQQVTMELLCPDPGPDLELGELLELLGLGLGLVLCLGLSELPSWHYQRVVRVVQAVREGV